MAVTETGIPATRRAVVTKLAGLAGVAAAAGCAPGAGGKAPAASQQGGELTWIIADHANETQDWFANTVIPAFQKERPKAQVTMLYVNWGELAAKRGTLYAAGNGPDLLQSGAVMVVQYALDKIAMPIDDRLARWKDWNDYYPTTQATTRFRERQYGIPARIDARAMLYRKDLFDQRGLTLPQMWDELKTTALALTERNGTDVVRVGYGPVPFGNQQLFPIVWQNGGEVLSPDGRKPVFNSPAGVEALRYWTDLLDAVAPAGATVPQPPQGVNPIAAGIVAAQLTGEGVLDSAVKRSPEVVSQIVVRPPLKKVKAQVNVFNNWFGLGTQSKLPDLAWDLLTFFNRQEHLLEYNRTIASIVPRKSLRTKGHMADPRYQMPAWLEVVEKYARPQPLVPNYADCWKAIDQVMAAVRAGKQGPKEALDDAARQWQLLLDQGYAGK